MRWQQSPRCVCRGIPLPAVLQTVAVPPAPAARLATLTCLLSLATLLCFHAAPLLALTLWRHQLQRGAAGSAVAGEGSSNSAGQWPAGAAQHGGEGSIDATTLPDEEAPQASAAGPTGLPGQQQQPPARAQLRHHASAYRPAVPMQRGLSARFEALERQHPRRHRALALGGLVVCSIGVCTGQIVSPGFVDPAIGEQGGAVYGVYSRLVPFFVCYFTLFLILPCSSAHSDVSSVVHRNIAVHAAATPPALAAVAGCGRHPGRQRNGGGAQHQPGWAGHGWQAGVRHVRRSALESWRQHATVKPPPAACLPHFASLVTFSHSLTSPQSTAGSLGTTRGWIGFGLSVATVMSGGLALILMQVVTTAGMVHLLL